jgi:hypothetical protein
MIEISHTNAFQSFSYSSLLDVQYFISYQIPEEEKVKEKEDKGCKVGHGQREADPMSTWYQYSMYYTTIFLE